MISIERGPCPACLGRSISASRYRGHDVVEALWKMQHGKCCYSEMRLPEDGHGKAVEHFRPKDKFKWQRNEWGNLLLVCPQCNGKKSNHFPGLLTSDDNETCVAYYRSSLPDTPTLIDPSDPEVEPEEHLTYFLDDTDLPFYGQILARGDSVLGKVTIEVTGIDGTYFQRERASRVLEVLMPHYVNILRAHASENTRAYEAALEAFAQLMADTEPFAGLAREFARQKKLDRNFALVIPGRDSA